VQADGAVLAARKQQLAARDVQEAGGAAALVQAQAVLQGGSGSAQGCIERPACMWGLTLLYQGVVYQGASNRRAPHPSCTRHKPCTMAQLQHPTCTT